MNAPRILTFAVAALALVLNVVPAAAQQGPDTPSGTIAFGGRMCDDYGADPTSCPATSGIGSISFHGPDGLTLTMAQATTHGGTSVWGETGLVPLTTYNIDISGLQIPAGYELWNIVPAPGTVGGGSVMGWYVDLVNGSPNAELYAVFVPSGAETDADGDGLTTDEEAHLGTSDNDADSDDDGHDDGAELAAGSDPTDPNSVPNGNAESNSITITKYVCPVGFEGKNVYENCTETLAGIEFTVSLDGSEFAVSAETDTNGVVAFEGLGSGAFTISEEIPGDFNEFEVLCWGDNVPGAPEPRQIAFTRFDANGVGLELTQGEELACRWVNKPVDAKSDPEPTPKPTATPSAKPAPRVNQLPNTGTGPTVAGRDTNATTPVLTLVVGLAVAGLVMVRRRRTA